MVVCACVSLMRQRRKIGISQDSLAVSASIYKLVVIQVAAKRGTRGNLCVNENLHTFKNRREEQRSKSIHTAKGKNFQSI